MADKIVVETLYSKTSKFEILKDSSVFSTKFYLYKNGRPHRGYFTSLRDAVRAAKEEGAS